MRDRGQLIQEDYIDTLYGPWKVLVICICLNRSSWMQAEKVVRNIITKYPSPRMLSKASPIHIYDIVKGLGFGNSRACYLITMSSQYNACLKLYDKEYIDYGVMHFSGCGQYAKDAWTLFVLKKKCAPRDRLLKNYAERVKLYGQ